MNVQFNRKRNVLNWVVAAGILSTPWTALRVGEFLTFSDTCTISALVVLIFSRRDIMSDRISFWLLLTLVPFCISLLSLLSSSDLSGSFINGVKWTAAIVFASLNWRLLPDHLHLLGFKLFTFGSGISALVGYFFQDRIFGVTFPGQFDGRYAGLSSHPNQLGALCAISLSILALLFFKKRGVNLGWVMATTLNLLGLVACLSVGSSVAVTIGVLGAAVIANIGKPNAFARQSALILALVTLAALVVLLNERLYNRITLLVSPQHSLSTNLNGVSTAEVRFYTWQWGVNQVFEHPWTGNGFAASDTFEKLLSLQPHNLVILTAVAGGVPAIFFILTVFVISIRNTLFNIQNIEGSLAAVSVMSLAVTMMIEPLYYTRWVYFGIGWGVANFSKKYLIDSRQAKIFI